MFKYSADSVNIHQIYLDLALSLSAMLDNQGIAWRGMLGNQSIAWRGMLGNQGIAWRLGAKLIRMAADGNGFVSCSFTHWLYFTN